MMMTEPAPMRKNDNKIVRKIGMTGGEIKRFAISNQKIKRKMG